MLDSQDQVKNKIWFQELRKEAFKRSFVLCSIELCLIFQSWAKPECLLTLVNIFYFKSVFEDCSVCVVLESVFTLLCFLR